jgi:hypothetical protein
MPLKRTRLRRGNFVGRFRRRISQRRRHLVAVPNTMTTEIKDRYCKARTAAANSPGRRGRPVTVNIKAMTADEYRDYQRRHKAAGGRRRRLAASLLRRRLGRSALDFVL